MRKTPMQRFEAMVDYDSGKAPAHNKSLGRCHLWKGSKRGKNKHGEGYGQFQVNGRKVFAHRWLFEQRMGRTFGFIHLRHKCDVRHCVRFSHIQIGTQKQNLQDMRERGRAPTIRSRIGMEGARAIRRDYASGESIASIARRLGRECVRIREIVRNKRYIE